MADRRLAIGDPDSRPGLTSPISRKFPILFSGARQLGFAPGKLRHRTANGAWRKTAGCFETVRSIDRKSTARKIRRRRRSDVPIYEERGGSRGKRGIGEEIGEVGTSLMHGNPRGRYGSESGIHWSRDFFGK